MDPETASTTLLPVFSQAVRAFWMRVVSSDVGGEARCELVNWAVRVWQTAGLEGWVTVRVSPVARVWADVRVVRHASRASAQVVGIDL